MATTDARVYANYDGVLDPEGVLAAMGTQTSPIPLRFQSRSSEENTRSLDHLIARVQGELRKDDPGHQASCARIEAAREAGRIVETYRRISLDDALMRLG